MAWLKKLERIDPLIGQPDPRLGSPPISPARFLCRSFGAWLEGLPNTCALPPPEHLGEWLYRPNCPSPFGLGQYGVCRRPSGSASFQQRDNFPGYVSMDNNPLLHIYKFSECDRSLARFESERWPDRDYASTPQRAALLRVYLAAFHASTISADFFMPKVGSEADMALLLSSIPSIFRRGKTNIRNSLPVSTPGQAKMVLACPFVSWIEMSGRRHFEDTAPALAGVESWFRPFTVSIMKMRTVMNICVRNMVGCDVDWVLYANKMTRAGIAWEGRVSGVELPRTNLSLLSELQHRTFWTSTLNITAETIIDMTEMLRALVPPPSTETINLAIHHTPSTKSMASCLAENVCSRRFARIHSIVLRCKAPRWPKFGQIQEAMVMARKRYQEEWWMGVRASLDKFIPGHMYSIASRFKAYACPYPGEPSLAWE